MSGECEEADNNPSCPYLSQINQQASDIKAIRRALIGDDMQSGIVAEIQKFKILWKITIFIAGATAAGFISLILKLILQV